MRLFLVPTIGSRIKDARLKAGLSQGELGDKVGTSQQLIGKLEKDSPSSSKYYWPISKTLSVDYDWLMTGDKNKPTSVDVDPEYIIGLSKEALVEAVNSVKKIMIRKQIDPAVLDKDTTNLVMQAFEISMRGKLTGDYITTALDLSMLSSKKAG